MKSSNSELRAELGTTLRSLQDSLLHLANYLRQEARDVWFWQVPKSPGTNPKTKEPHDLPRDQALASIASGIQAIKYEGDQHPHESRIYPGIVAVPLEGIALTDEVNRHKTTLARVLRDMDGRTELGTIDPQTGERVQDRCGKLLWRLSIFGACNTGRPRGGWRSCERRRKS